MEGGGGGCLLGVDDGDGGWTGWTHFMPLELPAQSQ